MRRAQTIVVVIALLATPLALLSRATSQAAFDCNQFCCLPHGSHSSQAHEAIHEGMSCQHGNAGHVATCVMNSGHHHLDYGLNSPVDPTSVSAEIRIAPPDSSRRTLASHSDFPAFGFRPVPFEPPRS